MITTSQMRKLEDLSEERGVSKLKLMENAGIALFEEITRNYDNSHKILIVCGHGNNGGDGFVLAKYLHKDNYQVKVLFLGQENKLKKESGFNYWQIKELDQSIFIEDPNYDDYDVIVDAMLGTGVEGKIREPYSSVIDKINQSNKKIVAVDIPTGLNPDTGQVLDKMVEADLIITFHDIKPGLMKFKEKVVIKDIGILV